MADTKTLTQLIYEIDCLFENKKNQKYSIIQWSLVKWQDGYWSVQVTDDWHKWLDKGIKESQFRYFTPKVACKEFLKFIKANKINIKKLQSKE